MIGLGNESSPFFDEASAAPIKARWVARQSASNTSREEVERRWRFASGITDKDRTRVRKRQRPPAAQTSGLARLVSGKEAAFDTTFFMVG